VDCQVPIKGEATFGFAQGRLWGTQIGGWTKNGSLGSCAYGPNGSVVSQASNSRPFDGLRQALHPTDEDLSVGTPALGHPGFVQGKQTSVVL